MDITVHVALIIDGERLEREQSMLNRLCIGLMIEGVQLTRIVPDQLLPDSISKAEKRIALAPRIETSMRVLPWMRNMRANRIAEQLEKSPPDVLYAVGQKAWQLGIDLGATIQRPVLLDVWSARQVRKLPRLSGHSPIAGYVASSGSIARLLGRGTEPENVYLVPMGVSIPPQPRVILGDENRLPAIAIIGGANDLPAYQTMLGALSMLAREQLEAQIFLELRGPQEHNIWRAAEKLDLLGCISIVGEASHYRTLLTGCDLLLMPEALGDIRSILLEAMALGILVIAKQDPSLDMLIDQDTAILVGSEESALWASHIRDALVKPDHARRIGLNGRQIVANHHRSSEQVNRLIHAVEKASFGGNFRLPPNPA